MLVRCGIAHDSKESNHMKKAFQRVLGAGLAAAVGLSLAGCGGGGGGGTGVV
jgi:hypothetical protein